MQTVLFQKFKWLNRLSQGCENRKSNLSAANSLRDATEENKPSLESFKLQSSLWILPLCCCTSFDDGSLLMIDRVYAINNGYGSNTMSKG